jgi:hypothetical protein
MVSIHAVDHGRPTRSPPPPRATYRIAVPLFAAWIRERA